MLRNYLVITLRNLLRHKLYTSINILGLTIGLTCVLLITLYIQFELSYENSHQKADRIYRVTRDFWGTDGTPKSTFGRSSSHGWTIYIQQDFPDLEATARTIETSETFIKGDEYLREDYGYYAENQLFEIFDFDFLKGRC